MAKPWTVAERNAVQFGVDAGWTWAKIAEHVPPRSAVAVMRYAYRAAFVPPRYVAREIIYQQVGEVLAACKQGEVYALDWEPELTPEAQRGIVYHMARKAGLRVSLRARRYHLEITIKASR